MIVVDSQRALGRCPSRRHREISADSSLDIARAASFRTSFGIPSGPGALLFGSFLIVSSIWCGSTSWGTAMLFSSCVPSVVSLRSAWEELLCQDLRLFRIVLGWLVRGSSLEGWKM